MHPLGANKRHPITRSWAACHSSSESELPADAWRIRLAVWAAEMRERDGGAANAAVWDGRFAAAVLKTPVVSPSG
jgi:hypothetical protein